MAAPREGIQAGHRSVPQRGVLAAASSETTFTFLLLLTVWCSVRFWTSERLLLLVLAAILMALAILCRPIAVFFPFLLGATLFVPPHPRVFCRPADSPVRRDGRTGSESVDVAQCPQRRHEYRVDNLRD